MIKLKKIIIFTIFFLYIMMLKSYAGYIYENEIGLFRLNRNLTKPTYVKTYDKASWTNEDVLITINSDKILEILDSDFVLGDDGKTLTKTVKENEKGIIKVRDEDYNHDEIEYEVSWIDKEAPQIIGAENGEIYSNDVKLQYLDNGEIDEIFVDKYNDEFSLYTKDIFTDSGSERFVPYTKDSITAWVKTHPRGVEKYNYYLNGTLYATTDETKYTFQGLEEVQYNQKILVEGLDKNGNVLASQEYSIKTGIFEDVILEKTDTSETVKITGISDNVTQLVCYTWVDGKYDSTLTYGDVKIENNEAICSFDIKDFQNLKTKYKMHFYFYYKEGDVTKSFVYGGTILMSEPYIEEEKNPTINDFIVNGNYYVRVKDKAGNESEIDFVIQK